MRVSYIISQSIGGMYSCGSAQQIFAGPEDGRYEIRENV